MPQKLVEVLTNADIEAILACLDPDMASGCRDFTMVITFLDTGLRLSELVGLKMADTHVDEGYLKVMGKGAKERMVPPAGKSASNLGYPENTHPGFTDERLSS